MPTVPIRRFSPVPCPRCHEHRPVGAVRHSPWRGARTGLCWRCHRDMGDVLRAERLAGEASPPLSWPLTEAA